MFIAHTLEKFKFICRESPTQRILSRICAGKLLPEAKLRQRTLVDLLSMQLVGEECISRREDICIYS